jgi:hypothetical protein
MSQKTPKFQKQQRTKKALKNHYLSIDIEFLNVDIKIRRTGNKSKEMKRTTTSQAE